jgi:hypothetical protein
MSRRKIPRQFLKFHASPHEAGPGSFLFSCCNDIFQPFLAVNFIFGAPKFGGGPLAITPHGKLSSKVF